MPRYFFNLLIEGRNIPDHEGQDLDTLEEARRAAELSLCEIAADRLRAGDVVDLHSIEIADPRGIRLAEVLTEEAILSRFSVFRKLQE